MIGLITERVRSWLAFGLAGGVVLVDSASRLLSMCADLVLVALLLAVVQVGRRSKARD